MIAPWPSDYIVMTARRESKTSYTCIGGFEDMRLCVCTWFEGSFNIVENVSLDLHPDKRRPSAV